jgi:uncharacterized membrane protein YdfJ with MMPL/SSD domain
VLVLPPAVARALLAVVSSGALLGVAFQVLWVAAPRWLYVPINIGLGRAAARPRRLWVSTALVLASLTAPAPTINADLLSPVGDPPVFLAQVALIVAFGVLVDALVVRSVLVPAAALDVGSAQAVRM